ncbi:cation diffusion facilitator family transporter [Magnetospirillum sulfuroxidans]|uniref:Cation diffusion facilitator family transporter n=1 Tax=Magnetospirillum sulfuroxidans TaxID=611300 RepID=A0ABS5IFB8_9PROT|nr:cation diffusion facilitator family transporter [Magnetospirillum sulfuroxidans]MBR9973116.1 cation diffusion facilitator family transporter [Magnetospirillum sulfuroxidans]
MSALTVPPENEKLMRQATYASVATASILIVAKLTAWAMTGSVAILSTLIDSTLDAAASLINLWAVRHALTPADHDHRFGHGKAEPLAGLGQAAFILGSGILLMIEAVKRLFQPEEVTQGLIGIGVMVFSIVMTFALVAFQKYVLTRAKSVAIAADSLHYSGDVLINGSVIISLSMGMFSGWTFLDPLFAIAIALFLLWNAWSIAQSSMDMLMDRELAEDDRSRIIAIARSHPEVRDLHDLRTRLSGQLGFIQLHLELEPQLPLVRAHAIADWVEHAIEEAFPNFEVIIHQDPAGLRESHPGADDLP